MEKPDPFSETLKPARWHAGDEISIQAITFGKYQLEKRLGKGGMGAVYLASDPDLNRKIALKILLLEDEGLVERFLREARASANLKHPNIIQVYEVGTIDGRHYFTMEYIEGNSLKDLIENKDRPLTNRLIVETISEIASALAYAHSRGIIHRDVKPQNIMVDSQGRPYLTDFGLFKQLTGLDKSLTLSGDIVGTPDYMAPEQATGKKQEIDPRSDVYALGATLYHSITGRVPFTGSDLYEVLNKVINEDPPAPSSIIKVIPRDLETICLKCLEKDRTRRYQSATEVALEIKRYLQGEPITAKMTSRITKLYLKAKKNKAISISIASASVILLAVIIALLISSARTSQRLEELRKDAFTSYKEGKIEQTLVACERFREITKDDEELNKLYDTVSSKVDKRTRAMKTIEQAEASPAPDQKIQAANKALDIDPTFAEAHLLMGRGYKAKSDEAGRSPDECRELQNKAVECFTEAIKLQPDLAYAYYERAMITAYQWNKPEEAISDFEMVLKYDPESNIGYFAKGNIEKDQKRYDEAIKSYTKAIEIYPKDSWSYTNRGNAHYVKGNPKSALADYDRAIELDPKSVKAYTNRGNAHYVKGNLESAVADYSKAIELDPKDAIAYNNRGIAYKIKGDLESALADYTKSIELDPKYAEAYSNRGNAYKIKGDIEKAIVDYTKSIELNPHYADAYNNRGSAYKDKGELDLAIADCNKAIELNPKYANAYNNRGIAYKNKGEIEQAIVDYTKSIELNPKYAEAYVNRGNAYKIKGDLESALADYTKAIELNQKLTDAYRNRAETYAKKAERESHGDKLRPDECREMYSKAIADMERFLELAAKHPQAGEMREKIEEWRGKLK